MRVGIDVTPLLRKRTGIAVCTEMLLESARAAGHDVVGLVSGWRALGDGVPDDCPPVHANFVPAFTNPVLVDWLGWPTVETILGPVDIFVATNHEILPSRRATNVAFVHDLGRLQHPELYGRRQVRRFRTRAKRLGHCANLLIVPTEAVAREVVDLGLAPAARVRVVPWGARAFPTGERRHDSVPSDAPYMLCVATLERRKNVTSLVRAFQRAASSLPHHLVLAGGPGSATEDVRSAARGNGASHRIHMLGHASENVLGALYRNADVAVCPSLYEGFGLTLLEAMAAGCPVLATDIPAHREVGGEAVRLVPAGDESALMQGLVDLARDQRARAQLRNLGLERSRRFTWNETRHHLSELLRIR